MVSLSKQFLVFSIFLGFCEVPFAKPAGIESLGNRAFASFKNLSPTLASSTICSIWGGAPDQSPWILASSDVDGNYVVLKYSVPPGIAVPAGWPVNIIYSWQLDGLFAPWIVYFGDEKISQVKINSTGDVAFWRTVSAPTFGGFGGHDDLVSCELDSLNKNSQWTAYPCANSISNAKLVDSILHTYTLSAGPLGLQPNQL